MQGAGNDYIYINAINSCPSLLENLAISMSDRHKGVGADGLIVILPSEIADFKMRMFNIDGSEGEMCGNGSRCVGKYVYDNGLTTKKTISLETVGGIRVLNLHIANGKVKTITVDMGEPIFDPQKIPVNSNTEILNRDIVTSTGTLAITAVSMGNPHGVVFVDDISKIDIHNLGRELETNPLFPNKANIEFGSVINNSEIKMRVWERGSGETLSCGTGACASVVAGVLTGRCHRECTVHLLGGDLQIKWDEQSNRVYMTGDAVTVFEGEYTI